MGTPEIQPFKPSDATKLAQLHHAIFPNEMGSTASFQHRLTLFLEAGSKIWLMFVEDALVGYALLLPVPGLNEYVELRGGIDPNRRRRGLGSRLLHHLIENLANTAYRQITHPVPDLESPAALFLLQHNFFVEHVEDTYTLDDFSLNSIVNLPNGFRTEVYPRPIAIRRFRHLYDRIFGEHPWYQPYLSDQEVSADLVDPSDIIFLTHKSEPIGFLWLRRSRAESAEIEPVGISPDYQGQGLGRGLLQQAIQRLADEGATSIRIGAWQNNRVAGHLYQNLGFKYTSTLTYLAYILNH